MSDTMGRNVGPLFMRTYGRSKVVRKVDAWLTPDYRKKAFSSTDGSDPSLLDANDSSVQLKKRKKKGRLAKKKATANLKEVDSDVENVFLPEPVPKTNKVTSQRKPPRQPMKKGRGRVLLSSMSENEQPIAAMRRGQKKSARIFSTSESEEDSLMKNPRVTSVLQKKNSRAKTLDSENSAAPEPGKFVTARRRVQSVKPRGPSSKPLVLCPSVTLDSSDDFARAVPALPRAVTRRKRLPLRPPVGLERTSSDVSMGPPPGAARAPLPRSLLRESLNASADDPSLACHAPLFSSTPSAALGRRLPQRLQDPSLSGIHFSTEDSATDTEPAAGHRPQQKRPRRGPTAHSRLRDTATASRSPLAATRNDRSKLVIMCRRVAECHHEAAVSGTNGQPAPPAPAEQTGPVNVELADHSVVEVEEMEVAASPAAAPSPTEPPSQPADSPSGAQGTGVEPGQEDQLASLVLFSRVEEQEEEDEEQAASGFVTAETRLDSLVEALKERCRTASPVVRLPRADLSLLPPLLSLDTSSRILSAGETFSSCLDSQPADRVSTRRGSGPVFELSSCAELPSICATVPPAPSAITPTRRAEDMEEPREEEEEEMEEEEEEEEMEEEEQEEEEEGEDKEEEEKETTAQVVGEVDEEESCVGEGGEASGLGELTERLKARCVSCQPVILLDSLRLSPFLLRHHAATVASSSSAPGAPVPAVKTAPASKSSSSDSIALPAPTTPSFSNSSAGLHSDAAAGKGQPERHRLNKRRLSNSFPTVGGGSGGSGGASGSGSSPEQTVLANRSKLPAGRVGTGRKACVSGLSANRWTKRDTNLARAQHNAHDSLDFGPASVAKPSKELLSNWSALPVTPARAEQLNISSILAGLSPDASLSTHMWSRLKAALSVHKKKTAFATPRRLGLSSMQSPAVQRLNASQDIFASPSLASLTRLSRYSHSSQLSVAEDISDAEKVFQECQQEGPQTFDQCIPPARMKLCRKIGEGTFGEVFSTTNADGQPVALKIIPVEGKQKVNGEDQKSFGEILHEIIISKELSSLDEKEENRTGGFIGLHDLHCAQGSYPKQLLSAWDKFDKKRGSENDRPDFFGEEQFFLILEFEFGGSDLENMNGKLSSLAQAKSILQQVTAALAVAEQALCFEHRDLHWGNVLVKTTKQKECDYVLSGQTCSLETRGVQVNIIDYSLSRLEIDGLTVSCDISADEELFMGQGDYQFDIYRKMREENRNNWSEYHPHTNVLWLHYLTDKLLGMKYKSSGQGAQARALKSSLRAFHQDLPAFQSAADVLQRSSLFP